MKCDFCGKEFDVLYQGWFSNSEKYNPWAKGTATAGLMQMARGCRECCEIRGQEIDKQDQLIEKNEPLGS